MFQTLYFFKSKIFSLTLQLHTKEHTLVYTPAAGGVQENSFYSSDQFLHVRLSALFPRVVQDRARQLGIQNVKKHILIAGLMQILHASL